MFLIPCHWPIIQFYNKAIDNVFNPMAPPIIQFDNKAIDNVFNSISPYMYKVRQTKNAKTTNHRPQFDCVITSSCLSH